MTRRPLLLSVVVFAATLAAGAFLVARGDVLDRQERRRAAEDAARAASDAIEHELASSLAVPYALGALVREDEGAAGFDRLAGELLTLYGGIDALQLAPRGVIERIAPLRGNEPALGLDLLAMPLHRPDLLQAMRTRRVVLAGPFPLRQGGIGLAARLAVYRGAGDGERFWGFASAILKLPRVMEASHVDRLVEAGYDYELSREEPGTHAREVFARSREGALAAPPVTVDVNVPTGAWTLSVAPRAGWGARPVALAQYGLALAAALTIALLALRVLRQPEILEQRVRERTDALDRAERRHAALLDGIPDPAWLKDADGRFVAVNEALGRLAGRTPQELLGRTHGEVFGPVAEIDRHDREVLAAGAQRRFEERAHGEGDAVVFDVVKRPYLDASGSPLGIVGIARDVTERRAAEERLRHAHATLTAVVEASPLAVVRLDRAHRVKAWNSVAERIFGWTAAEVIGGALPIVPADGAADFRATIDGVLERGAPVTGLARRRQRKDGTLVDVHISVAPLRDADGRVEEVIVYYVDVTELRALEEALRQASKLEAVGQLAGGVAHDFNNLLTVINMHVQFMDEALPAASAVREDLEQVKAASLRATSLTRQLLAFSRRQVLQPRVLDVNEVIGETLKMLSRVIGEDVAVEVRCRTALWSVRADPGQLEQVLMNLAVNSRDAMPDGGTLTIATHNVTLEAAFARAHVGAAAGDHVLLEVSDTGTGMDEATRSRAFEPFFTTKPKGKGTGLGLAMVYGIVKQSGGFIDCASAPGRGTTVRVYLPRCEATAADELPARAGLRCVRATSHRVLLVEDDEAVRGVTARALRRCGYLVEEACGGPDALRLLARGGAFDVLVTDIVMPEMSGTELVHRVRAAGHAPAVLLVSGYAEDELVRRGSLPAGASFMPKPFTTEALAAKVHDVVRERRALPVGVAPG